MIKYIIKRLLYTIPTLLLTSILVFGFVRMIPGDAAEAMLGDLATEEELEAYRERMGLKEPIIKQYIIFITNAARGDLGTSVAYSAPVLDLILERMETTLFLGFMASIVILIFALPIGIISAVKVNSAIDQTITVVAMFLASVPAFWLGLMLMLWFAVERHWFPTSGFPSVLQSGDWSNLKYLVLPAFTLATPNTALVVRMIRSSMLDVVKEDYVRTARAKGLSLPVVYIKHVFRNSLNTVVTSFGFILAALISGSVITESIFALPGVGAFLTYAINMRDYAAVQGSILVIAFIFIIVNLFVDLSYALIDPRVRYS
jgi:peptide/nickel transport system permease protein